MKIRTLVLGGTLLAAGAALAASGAATGTADGTDRVTACANAKSRAASRAQSAAPVGATARITGYGACECTQNPNNTVLTAWTCNVDAQWTTDP